MNHLLGMSSKPRRHLDLARRLALPKLPVAVLLACLCVPLRAQTDAPQSLPEVTLHIGKAALETEIASTPAEDERGLMYRAHLSDNTGMIFFLPVGHATFWMKSTLIPLSIAFLDKNGVILEIHDMQPADPSLPDNEIPRTHSDSDQVAFAIETNLHWFALNGIKPGEKVDPSPATLMKTTAP
jgi:uncharacterized membrane protein (UPF0127 family)